MNEKLYLKSNTIAEPLIDRWYAWSYLLSPVTSALYLKHSHLPLLESFVNAPHIHVTALNDPAMRGGPFIRYGIDRQKEVEQLLIQDKSSHTDLIELATDIQTLQDQLQAFKGESLEPHYKSVPSSLNGYLELVYDLYHHASFRLFEKLLYHSHYYKSDRQSISLLLGDGDDRSFVLSTPRLADPDRFELPLPFQHPGFSALFSMRDRPQTLDWIMAQLELPESVRSEFSQFFTSEAPKKIASKAIEGIRIRYFGHACVLIETADVSILCDPLIGYPHPTGIERYSYQDLPDGIDYALITHHHQDHVMLETLLQLRHKIKTVIVPNHNPGSLIDPSLKLILEQIGFQSVRSIGELEEVQIPNGVITGIPVLGEHGDLNIAAKLAYHIQISNRSILLAADSNNIAPTLYQHITKLLGPVDVLFIGMECAGAPYNWAYAPLLPQPVPRSIAKTRRLDGSNADRAINLVQQLQPEQVYVYAMGQEPWLTFITSIQYTADSVPIKESDRLVAYCQSQNILSDRMFGKSEIILEARAERRQFSEQNKFLNPTKPIKNMNPINISDLLAQLHHLDIKLTLDTTKDNPILRINAPKGALSEPLKAELKTRKPEIITFLQGQSNQVPNQAQLLMDAGLDQTFHPAKTPSNNAIEQILITGATGFVGCFLLAELLQSTQAHIHCLIRGETQTQAMQRIKQIFSQYQIKSNFDRSRLTIHLGDLSQPNFGLSPIDFEQLSQHIDTIYHSGAWVNHLLPYGTLRSTNVLGTLHLLNLATQGCHKVIHHLSSTSVFVTANTTGSVSEFDRLNANHLPKTGYAQTKWVSERLMEQAQDRDFAIQIYRLGGISGHSKTGAFNENDFLYRLVMGVVKLGSYPNDRPMSLRLLPIDYMVQSIVQLSQLTNTNKSSDSKLAYHLVHPNPVNAIEVFQFLESDYYPIQSQSYLQWRSKLMEIAQSDPQHPLYPLVALLPKDQSFTTDDLNPELTFSTQSTQLALNHSPPAIARPLLQVYIQALIQQNRLPSPATISA